MSTAKLLSWIVVLPGDSIAQGWTCKAKDKSDARALAKKHFGMPDRLPAGTIVRLVGVA